MALSLVNCISHGGAGVAPDSHKTLISQKTLAMIGLIAGLAIAGAAAYALFGENLGGPMLDMGQLPFDATVIEIAGAIGGAVSALSLIDLVLLCCKGMKQQLEPTYPPPPPPETPQPTLEVKGEERSESSSGSQSQTQDPLQLALRGGRKKLQSVKDTTGSRAKPLPKTPAESGIPTKTQIVRRRNNLTPRTAAKNKQNEKLPELNEFQRRQKEILQKRKKRLEAAKKN